MHWPHQMPTGDPPTLIRGNVIIQDGAAIAPGVLLQADPGATITVASGACIGMGSILHAQGGTLEVGTGATLGYGVLVVGSGQIGAGACVGSLTTLVNPTVTANQLIPSSTLMVTEEWSTESSPSVNGASASSPVETTAAPTATHAPAPSADTNGSEQVSIPQVYGRTTFERLMVSLFPHRSQNALSDSDSDVSSAQEEAGS